MTIIPESCAQGLVGSGVVDLLGTGKFLKVEQSVCVAIEVGSVKKIVQAALVDDSNLCEPLIGAD